MICVSLGRARHTRMIAEHKYLVEQGAELVELRLDFIGRAVNLKRLIENRPGPVVVTCRRREDGGRWMKSEQERMMLLRSAIAAGVEYVDIEADVASQIPRYGNTKRVISYHKFSDTPDEIEQIADAMAEEDADIVKLATMATTFSDNLRMLNMVKNARRPTIGICMGEIGMVTRILGERVGSPFTYATYSVDKKLAPGQLNWKEMMELYRYKEINQDTELFGVIADPVANSHAHLVQNTAFYEQGLNARYLPFRVPRDDLHKFMQAARELGISGVSVDTPHMENVVDYCTQAESSASGIGAVNTLIFQGKDNLGYNTDYRAAMDCISETFNLKKGIEKPMQGVAVMILGAGGVARAVAWGLRQRGADVTIASRTMEKSQLLASEIGCRCVEWAERHDPKVNLLVNATPMGMHPDVDRSPFDAAQLNQFMVVFDAVYNPESTLLIKYARKQGCRIITGVDMFVRRLAYQYKLFTGRDAPTRLMRKTIKEATSPVRLN
ncbi:shikimate dehydrogenase [Novipirellula artificiosorum]|uniref:Multifunctional fusion protein n=1 Tax=Novipirellula artificiosorum TaxID=2528016 RepID=A0A5C6DNM1_9BACT|nr:shikimate dehydrogenase [Novipirellula artificiosorum]TWU37261.1 Shikimate dehydrogenase [Novipirellula artificiosorum]